MNVAWNPLSLSGRRARPTWVAALCCTTWTALTACETPKPDPRAAKPLMLGESQKGAVDANIKSKRIDWRLVQVGAKGTLSLELTCGSSLAQTNLFVFRDGARSPAVRKRACDGENKQGLTEVHVDAGAYYVGVQALENGMDFTLIATFMPADPESQSGENRMQSGAVRLSENSGAEGVVSFRDANRSDWLRFDPREPGFVTFDLILGEQSGLKAEVHSVAGPVREFTDKITLEVKNTSPLWVRVWAPEPQDAGSYRLTPRLVAAYHGDKSGIVLRFNQRSLTISLGSDDGVKEGMRGFVKRPNGQPVEFIIEKVLRRTCRARSDTKLNDTDVNLPVELRRTQ